MNRYEIVIMIATLTTFTAFAHANSPEHHALTDFGPDSYDLGWRVINDNVMGGRSVGGFEIDQAILEFSGRTNTRGGGFSSIRSKQARFNLRGAEGIALHLQGDGREYTFRLEAFNRRVTYWANFSTNAGSDWETVYIPFETFSPNWRGRQLSGPALDPGRVDSIGLMIYDKQDGPFRLLVDSIYVYGTPTVTLSGD